MTRGISIDEFEFGTRDIFSIIVTRYTLVYGGLFRMLQETKRKKKNNNNNSNLYSRFVTCIFY